EVRAAELGDQHEAGLLGLRDDLLEQEARREGLARRELDARLDELGLEPQVETLARAERRRELLDELLCPAEAEQVELAGGGRERERGPRRQRLAVAGLADRGVEARQGVGEAPLAT